jgi:hypothetical protein
MLPLKGRAGSPRPAAPLERRRSEWPALTDIAVGQTSAFRAAEAAHEIDDQRDQQNQPQRATTDDRAANVKPATAKQQQQDHHK